MATKKKHIRFSTILVLVLLLTAALTVPAFAVTEAEVEAQVSAVGKETVTGNVLIWFLCAVAFLKVSQKIDSFMASLGVNVGHTGGSMLAEAMIATRGIATVAGAFGGGGGGRRAGGSTSGGGGSSGSSGAFGFLKGGLAGVVSRKVTSDAVKTATTATSAVNSVKSKASSSTVHTATASNQQSSQQISRSTQSATQTATQTATQIEKIENGIIYTRDHRHVKVVEVVPVNFLLRSAQEQRSIIYSFISYLKIAPVKVQFKVLTKRADIDRHVETVRSELERETDPNCRMLQEDYLRLIRQLGSREAITRRFFLIFEHEPLPGTKRGHEEEEAVASLQTAARTAANYLRQCGNTVLTPEDADEATAEILYHILCRQESNEQPFTEKVKRVLESYIAAGRPLDNIPTNEFYAPGKIDFSHGRYICIDGIYYAYLLVPSGGFKSQVPAGWLSLLVNAGDGIDLDMFLSRQPKDRMIRKLGQQLRINRSKIKETSDTNTDFDDLDGAIRSGYFLKDGLGNNEDFYYLNLLI